jgi:uncharacterized repeat protein (TIGR01451 family)
MISTTEQQAARELVSNASIAVKDINVDGNIEGHITVGNENVVGNDNIVVDVHDSHGAIVNITQTPSTVRSLSFRGQPLRLPRGFIGRRSYLDQIADYVKSNEAVLVYGQDGIGKTTLLAQASNGEAALSKPDGVIHLEGIDDDGKVLGKGDIIQRLFDSLFESYPPLKVTYPTARPYLSNRQPLVLIDHLGIPMADLRGLLDLFPNGALLVANAAALSDDKFLTIHLQPLTREESVQLFGNKSGFALDETTRPWIDKICDLLGDVPLAISKTANYIREYGLALREVAESLAAIQPPSQDGIQAAVERSVELIYPALNQQERDMLAITAAAPGNSVDRPWLESVAGGETTSQALERLELLVANSPRLRLPDGIKGILQSGRADLHAQQELLLRHLLDELKTHSLDFKFVEDELGNILGLLQWASKEGRWSDVIALGRAVDPYLMLHGFWDAWESVLKQVMAAAQNLTDLAARSWALHQLGTREIGVGTKKQAINMLLRALKIRLSQGDLEGAAYTLHNLGLILPPETKDPLGRKYDSTGQNSIPFWQKIWRRERDDGWIIPFILLGLAGILLLLLPILHLQKQAQPMRYHERGQEIEYTYTIWNSGLLPIVDLISLIDTKFKPEDKLCPDIRSIGNHDDHLDWGETMICTGFYRITPEDVKKGSVTNTASAMAGLQEPSQSVTIYFDPKYLTLRKIADLETYQAGGDKTTYTYIVKNAGSESLEGPVTISDDKMPDNQVPCPGVQTVGNKDGVFDPGELLACTAIYTIKPEDVKKCSVTNTAIASAGGIDSEPASVTIYCETGLLLKKSADRKTYEYPGDVINYTYAITNGGAEPLSGPVTVTDTVRDEPITVSCPDVSKIGNGDDFLDPNESLSCTATYIVTQDDIYGSCVMNTAIANAGPIRSKPQSVTVCFGIPPVPPPILTKSGDPKTFQDGGDHIITYTYVVTNPGTGLLKGPVTIQDDKIPADGIHCPDLSTIGNGDDALDPTEIVTCTAHYTIMNCPVTNTAIASVGGIDSEPASVTIYCEKPDDVLLLTKRADHETYRSVNDVIKYTYIVTNTREIPVKGPVTIQDDKISVNPDDCPAFNTTGNGDNYLDLGETIICNATYSITQPDMDKGSVTNVAAVMNVAGKIISNQDSVTIYEKALELKKSADPQTYEEVNQVIRYSYKITGRSKLPLKRRVTIQDDKISVNPDDCPAFNTTGNGDNYLDWGESITCTATATYSITQADLDHGSVTNTATASVDDVVSDPDTETITAITNPTIFLAKTAEPPTYDYPGQVITYKYTITNIGNVTLHPPFKITDDHIQNGPFECETDQPLPPDPEKSVTCTEIYNITEEDFKAKFMPKSVTNTATASVDFGGKKITATATATITCGPPEGWEVYIVRNGGNLSNIPWYGGIEVADLQRANCIGSRETIEKGEKLYVPYLLTIRGRVYEPHTGNGVSITVRLTDSNGNLYVEEQTNSSGQYDFNGFPPVYYLVNQSPVRWKSLKERVRDFTVVPVP